MFGGSSIDFLCCRIILVTVLEFLKCKVLYLAGEYTFILLVYVSNYNQGIPVFVSLRERLLVRGVISSSASLGSSLIPIMLSISWP